MDGVTSKMAKKSKINKRVSKEEEIAQLLREGTPPVELIRGGYARATVYKVFRRLKKEGIVVPAPVNRSSTTPVSKPDPSLEDDPDVFDLRKAVRKAELEKQLGQIIEQPDLAGRLAKVEVELDQAWDIILHLQEEVYATTDRLARRPPR